MYAFTENRTVERDACREDPLTKNVHKVFGFINGPGIKE